MGDSEHAFEQHLQQIGIREFLQMIFDFPAILVIQHFRLANSCLLQLMIFVINKTDSFANSFDKKYKIFVTVTACW